MKRFITILLILSLLSVPAFALDVSDFERIYNINAELLNAPHITKFIDKQTSDGRTAYRYLTESSLDIICLTMENDDTVYGIYVRCVSDDYIGDFLVSSISSGFTLMGNYDQMDQFYYGLMVQYITARASENEIPYILNGFTIHVGTLNDNYNCLILITD